MEIKMI